MEDQIMVMRYTQPCLVAFLVPRMFIPKSHVAGHPSGFSGPLVQLRESNWHAFRLVLTRNTGELFGQVRLYQYAIAQIVISHPMFIDVAFYPRLPSPFSLP